MSVISFLALPFAACVAFVLIHAYFGVHVLARRIVFADLALAQLSALGATIAFANGYAPTSAAGFAYAFAFTLLGAALLTLTRPLAAVLSQEAFVGIVYVVASAATVLVIDRSPQGAEHVKQMLIGSILMVDASQVLQFSSLYATIGALHWLARKPLHALSSRDCAVRGGRTAVLAWDFLFYASFGVVVTSSVTTAGVLLVFSFLIVPAVIGSLFAREISRVLLIAWGSGLAASAAGLAAAYAFDLPTGAAMVSAMGCALVLAGAIRTLWSGAPETRLRRRRHALLITAGGALGLVLVSGSWLVVNPSADQPLVALVERAVGGPARFLGANERETFVAAQRDALRFRGEVDRLNRIEHDARRAATPLSDDEVRRLASYQQSFNEMVRGEQFVLDVLRVKARQRERWLIGVPAIIVAIAGFVMLVCSTRLARGRVAPRRPAASVTAPL